MYIGTYIPLYNPLYSIKTIHFHPFLYSVNLMQYSSKVIKGHINTLLCFRIHICTDVFCVFSYQNFV